MPQGEAGRDRGAGARHAGDQREALDETDDQPVDGADRVLAAQPALPLEGRVHPLGDDDDDAPDDERRGHHPEAAQRSGDDVAREEADEADRDRADDDGPRQPVVGVATRLGVAQPAEPREREAHEVLEEVDERRGDGADLDEGRVGRHRRVVDLEAEQLLRDGQVPRRGDGEVLGETFDNAEDDGVEVAEVCHGSGRAFCTGDKDGRTSAGTGGLAGTVSQPIPTTRWEPSASGARGAPVRPVSEVRPGQRGLRCRRRRSARRPSASRGPAPGSSRRRWRPRGS